MAIAILEFVLAKEIRRVELSDRLYLVGRGAGCHIRFSDDADTLPHQKLLLPNDQFLSQIHATLLLVEGAFPYYRIKDGQIGSYSGGTVSEGRPSTNGLYINGKRLTISSGYRHAMSHGDIVRLSPKSEFLYLNPSREQRSDEHDTLPEEYLPPIS